MARDKEYVERQRVEAGLPSHRCPACEAPEPHWVPDSLRGSGYFICQQRPAGEPQDALVSVEFVNGGDQ